MDGPPLILPHRLPGAPLILTSDQVLFKALALVGFNATRQNRVNRAKNLSRFRTHYNSHPRVYADLFYRLQVTQIDEARVDCSVLGDEKTTNYFLMAIHLLACYPKEEEAEGVFSKSIGVCDRTWRNWSWLFVRKIACLFPEIIVWPDEWTNPANPDAGETIFTITVDGIHCEIDEPTLPSFAENKKYYSHKFHSAGLDYEIALSIFEQKCVWVAGPYPAGTNDISVFRHGLKQKMLDARAANGANYRAIADKGYRGERELISVPSSMDTDEVRDFKGRALSRHETFNSRLKCYECLDERFRHHNLQKHRDCFYAVVAIVQIQLDNGFHLFSS